MLVSDELRLSLSGSHPPPRCRPAELCWWDPSLRPRALPPQLTLVLLGPCQAGSPGAACTVSLPHLSLSLSPPPLSLLLSLSVSDSLSPPSLPVSLQVWDTLPPPPAPPWAVLAQTLCGSQPGRPQLSSQSLEKTNQLCCRTKSPSSKNRVLKIRLAPRIFLRTRSMFP